MIDMSQPEKVFALVFALEFLSLGAIYFLLKIV